MTHHVPAAALFLSVGLAYWTAVSMWSGAPEPWDAAGYWTMAYPGILVLSALAGIARPSCAWGWGPLLVMPQVLVVLATAGASPLLAAGLLYAVALSLPAALLSAAAGCWRRRSLRAPG